MAHPFLWFNRPFFYAIGNTPAISFTDNLSPEEDAEILSLGCGDVRNLIYTLFVDESHGRKGKAKLDVTCCDLEPAVLARNILFFALLSDPVDGSKTDALWNLYYDIYVNDDAHALITKYAEKLAGISTTMEDWHASEYGKWMRMISESTLKALNGLWRRYAHTANLTTLEKDSLLKRYSEDLKDVKTFVRDKGKKFTDAIRAAGVIAIGNEELTSAVEECYEQFWSTNATTRMPNPTFAFNIVGEQFALNFSSNPILGYHILPAFLACKTLKAPSNTISPADLLLRAQKQFGDWCKAFQTTLRDQDSTSTTPAFTLRFFAGDYAALCTALQYSENGQLRPGVYTHGWDSQEVQLFDSDYGTAASNKAPSSFNVIDTSNLVDLVGLMNLLISATPLLRRTPSSVLLTEAYNFDGKTPMDALQNSLCGADPQTLGTILGLFPSAYFAGYSSRSSYADSITRQLPTPGGDESGGAFERIQWKILCPSFSTHGPYLPEQLSIDALALAAFLFGMYLRMFNDENRNSWRVATARGITPLAVDRFSIIHYVRETFAKFLTVVKSSVTTNWAEVAQHLMNFIDADRNLAPDGFFHNFDLITQLHLHNIIDSSQMPPYESDYKPPQITSWKTIPTVITINLVVPRRCIGTLSAIQQNMTTPMLQAVIEGSSQRDRHIFNSLHMVFGKLSCTDLEGEVSITPDENGLKGEEDLIVIFQVPSAVLGTDSKVAFDIRLTPQSAPYINGKLGLSQRIFVTDVKDTERVFMSKLQPNHTTDRRQLILKTRTQSSELEGLETTVCLDDGARKISSFAAKVSIVNGTHANDLAEGAKVSAKLVSANSVCLSFSSFERVISFPLPIVASSLRTRIERQSRYIEVVAAAGDAVFDPSTLGTYDQSIFPVVPTKNNGLCLWSIHRIDLDKLPALDPTRGDLKWVDQHVLQAMSMRELSIVERAHAAGQDPSQADPMAGVKQLIGAIFGTFIDSRPANGLVLPVGESLLFLTDIRLDLSNGTVVLDACVLPLATDNASAPDVHAFASKHQKRFETYGIALSSGDQERLWKELLVSFIERCRGTSYSHSSARCEYRTKNSTTNIGTKEEFTIPVSYETKAAPFCSCSSGKPSQAFLDNKEWAPLAKYVSRAAIGPIFNSELREIGALAGMLKRH